MSKKNYIYDNVEVIKIIDGDTITVNIDLGFNLWKKATLRLYGVNAYETKGEERELGLKSKAYIEETIPVGSFVKMECLGKDKYGRWLANIYKDNLFVNRSLIEKGHAIEYLL